MIEIKKVTKTYGGGTDSEFQALERASALPSRTANSYRSWVLPDQGKSTLMHILGALDTPSSGTIFSTEKTCSTLSDDQLADIRGKKSASSFSHSTSCPNHGTAKRITPPYI